MALGAAQLGFNLVAVLASRVGIVVGAGQTDLGRVDLADYLMKRNMVTSNLARHDASVLLKVHSLVVQGCNLGLNAVDVVLD